MGCGSQSEWGDHRLLVAERDLHYISIFSPNGERLQSFGSQGSGPGPFNYPKGHVVAVDDDGNILVADLGTIIIQKFTSDDKHIISVGSLGSNRLQFTIPLLKCNHFLITIAILL